MNDLALTYDGRGLLLSGVRVEAVRGFPITAPSWGISLVDGDGREHAWIEDLEALPAALRELLDGELAKRDFMPQLRRVLSISGHVEPTEWEVETDRGRTRFTLASEDDVRRLPAGRALIHDAHGIRYLIADVEALDGHSRRLLERFL